MRRSLLTLSAVFALAVLANPVDAQLKFGAQAAMITSLETASELDGNFGIGGRVMLDPPLFPIAAVGSVVYYDCTDCTYWTGSLAVQLRMPLPVVAPYVLVGYQTRQSKFGGSSNTENGPMVGAGVQFNFMMSLFIEATMEFNEEITGFPDVDTDPIVIKGGIMFG